MSIAIQGLGVGVGNNTAIGRVLKLAHGPTRAKFQTIAADRIDTEIRRFQHAVAQAAQQLRAIRQDIPPDTPEDILEFIDTHLLMLEDKALSEAPVEIIREQACNAEWALQRRRDQLIEIFEQMDDVYLRTRKDDLDHVVNRIMGILQGHANALPQNAAQRIVVARDLTPADAIMLHHQGAAGFITEFGSPMSHMAILARSLNIPAIVGAHGAFTYLQADEIIVLDAHHGTILADCDEACLNFFRARLRRERAHQRILPRLRKQHAITRDGQRIMLQANIELAEDAPLVLASGSDGVGLYRTEFLFMNREDLPDEEEQFKHYLNVLQTLDGLPITLRTLDLGADKQCQYHPNPGNCPNPALGLRAIRLCLKEADIFRTQLRAMLRLSAFGKVRILLPMITNLWEAHYARALIDDEMHSLSARGIAVDSHIEVGGMIETPAAALIADALAEVFDFLSIGTNDLIQYTLAVDRTDDSVSFLYDPLHPAILKLLHRIIRASKKAGIPLSMCGEMAGDPRYTPLLLGMGLDNLSMQPSAIPEIKQNILRLDIHKLRPRVERLLTQLHQRNIEQALLHLAD